MLRKTEFAQDNEGTFCSDSTVHSEGCLGSGVSRFER